MMKRRRNFVSVLGVSMLAALSLTAIFASSAQAAGNGLFLVNLQSVHGTLKVEGHGGAGSLLASGLTIECLLATAVGNITELDHAKNILVVFRECKSPTGGEDVCLVNQSEITTLDVLAELLLLGTKVRFTPEDLHFAHVGLVAHEEECGLFAGEIATLSVKGEVCADVVEGDKLKLLLEDSHCSGGLKIGGNHALIHGPNPVLIEDLGLKVTTHA